MTIEKIAYAVATLLCYALLCATMAWQYRSRQRAAQRRVDALLPATPGLPIWWVTYASQTGQAEELALQTAQALHWTRLCDVANAVQAELGLPAPAVSIAGDKGYGLWLSLATAVPQATAQRFAALLWTRYVPDVPPPDSALMDLPPCLHQSTGKWAAFINPGLGASFAEESGLEMAPPHSGQAALLDGLLSISDEQFRHALGLLQQSPAAEQSAPPPIQTLPPAAPADGLLLKDATLEDIVQFLHARNIEPTFRHVVFAPEFFEDAGAFHIRKELIDFGNTGVDAFSPKDGVSIHGVEFRRDQNLLLHLGMLKE
eukprot:gene33749-38145_t